MFEGQTCFISGGTGSWGQELVRKLLREHPKEIRIFSRNEYRQVEMQRRLGDNPAIRYIIGDVRDAAAVHSALAGVDYVFHLAALKHVPVCEDQPDEAMKTNVTGTQNIIQASIDHRVKKVMDVSTDKAVNPHNFYGLTKSIGERLIIHANDQSAHTRFVCVRGGNVLGTNGSVVPLFKRQIRETGEVTLTHPEMTRFFLTLSDAIELLLKAARTTIGGEILVMRMNTCNIQSLAEVLAEELSTTPVRIRHIGIRQGEKLHEELVSRLEAARAYELENDYYVILPSHASDALKAHYSNLPHAQFSQYDSSENLMSKQEIRDMLIHGGFLP